MKLNCGSILLVLALFVCCMAWPSQVASGQISKERLTQLTQKYDWGSIYLSYGSIPDVIQLLDDAARMEKIKKDFKVSPPPQSMVAFLSNYKKPGAKESMILFQINFSASKPAALFLMSSDTHGNVQRSPMPPDDVLAAADWTDLYLTHAVQWWRLVVAIYGEKLGLKEGWQEIGQASNDPFLSEYKIGTLLIVFRQSQNQKRMEALKTEDPQLYETINQFNARYDTMITALLEKFRQEQKDSPNEKFEELANPRSYMKDLFDPFEQKYRRKSVEDVLEFQQNLTKRIYEEYRKVGKPSPF